MNFNTLYYKKLHMARKGKKILSKICKRYKDVVFLVFPEYDKEINRFALLYLDEFLFRSNYKYAVIITIDENLIPLTKQYSAKIEDIIVLSEKKVEDLICYYSLNPNLRDIKIISLEKPEGRRGSNLLNKNDLSLEQLIAIGIYKLLPFEKIDTNEDLYDI